MLLRIDASGGFLAATRREMPAFLADAMGASFFLFPPLTLFLLITGWYVIGLGHLPAIAEFAFFDAALACAGSFHGLPLGPTAWVPLAAFWVLAAGVACCLRSAQDLVATLAACVGAWAPRSRSAHSYVVGHSHWTSCANLTPFSVVLWAPCLLRSIAQTNQALSNDCCAQ